VPIYGVTPQGFVRKPLAQIMLDLQASLAGTFGADTDLSDTGPFGQLVADLAAPIDEVWQVAEDVYDSFDPDLVGGPRLASLCGITGTIQTTPSRSTDTLTCIGAAGSPVPTLSLVSVQNGGAQFRTTAPAIIAALAAWAAAHAYATLGELSTIGGNVYKVMTPGVSSAGPGPSGTGTDIVDGTVHWRYMGAGTAAVDVAVESVELGPNTAPAGTLTVIDTPVSGLTSVSNAAAAVLGIAPESDPDLRARRTAELEAQGEGGIDSMRADLLRVLNVTDAFVFENNTDAVDADGLPPHSVECVVLGGTDADVAQAVFSKGAGIATFGGVTVATVKDLAGGLHTVNFSRPTEKDVWVTVELTKDTGTYPADGDTQVAQALVDFAAGVLSLGKGYRVGDDVITAKLYAAIYSQVSGIVDVTKLWVGLVNPPTGAANIVIGSRELAKFATLRISVTSTPA
jgi:uncharacterized phage protein gp47/JayE